jgi:hypothetical protein
MAAMQTLRVLTVKKYFPNDKIRISRHSPRTGPVIAPGATRLVGTWVPAHGDSGPGTGGFLDVVGMLGKGERGLAAGPSMITRGTSPK